MNYTSMIFFPIYVSKMKFLSVKKLSVEAKEISASKELEKLILPGDTVIRNVEEVSTEEKFPDVTKDAANRTDHEDHKDETNFENAMTKDTSAGEEVRLYINVLNFSLKYNILLRRRRKVRSCPVWFV